MMAARKALDLDDTLSDAHTSMGWHLLYQDWDSRGAERETRRALELDPDSADAWALLDLTYLSQGRAEEAMVAGRRAVELAPFYSLPSFCLSVTYSNLGQLDNAIVQLQRTLSIDPGDANTHAVLAGMYGAVGRREKALEECEAALALGRSAFHRLETANVYAQLGEPGRARAILEPIENRWMPGDVSSFWIAVVHATLGEHDAAFEWLERAYRDRAPFMVFLSIVADGQKLRGDPRYESLIKRIGP
jgi:serine/threonine-protein kinase